MALVPKANVTSTEQSNQVSQDRSYELTSDDLISVSVNKKYYNIPTVVNGKKVNPGQAISSFRKGQTYHYGEFTTMEDAVKALNTNTELIQKDKYPGTSARLKPKVGTVISATSNSDGTPKGPLVPKNELVKPIQPKAKTPASLNNDMMLTPGMMPLPGLYPNSGQSQLMEGVTDDVIKSAIAGVSNGLLEANQSMAELIAAGMERTKEDPVHTPFTSSPHTMIPWLLNMQMRNPEDFRAASKKLQGIQDQVNDFWNPGVTLPGKLTEAMAQWLSVSGPASRSMKIRNGMVKWFAAGGAGDFAAFDPYEERLSNVLTQYDNPVFNNALTKWLAMDEDAPELENRMKQAAEGSLIGVTFEGFIAMARVAKGLFKAKSSIANMHGNVDRAASENVSAILQGEARLGEAFKEVEFSPSLLDDLIDGVDRTDPEDIVTTAVNAADGYVPTVVVKTEGGKPVEILSGQDVVELMHQIRRPTIKVKTIEATPAAKLEKDAEAVSKTFETSEAQTENVMDHIKKGVKGILSKEKWIDVNAKANQALEKAGPAGRDAVMKLNLSHHATGKARKHFKEATDKIYKDLTKEEVKTLDRLITAERSVQIARYNTKKKLPGGHTGDQYDNYITKLQQKLGPEKFGKLQNRAREHFEAMRRELTDLYDNGLISDTQYEKLLSLDYTPQQYLDQIDPTQVIEVGGKKVTVPDSGIYRFGEGSTGAVEMDQRLLLSQVMVRTQSRIMKANANRELVRLAFENPDNGLVSLKKKKGMAEIKTTIDGETVPIYMDNDIVGSWVSMNKEMSSFMANTMRILSGSAWLKPLATGHNPAFVLSTFPMDVSLAYMSTAARVGYSKHLPKYLAQLSFDLKETMSDAFKRTGALDDFIEEGGGIDFLTQQGRDFMASGRSGYGLLGDLPDAMAASKNIDKQWEQLKDATSYVNASFEAWMRLAIRNRGLKSGLSPEEATYEAIRYFDLSSGGGASKGVDTIIPYFNAMIQGFRSAGREAIKDPARTAAKAAWVSSASAGWLAYSYISNPEAMNSIQDKKKNTHVIIPSGLAFKDENGYKRHMYFQIKKDPTTAMVSILSDAAMINYYSQGSIDGSYLDSMKDSFMSLANVLPNVQAYRNYVDNKDHWRKDIWRSKFKPGEVSPRNEYIGDPLGESYLSKDTAEFYKQMGQITGSIRDHTGINVELSPIRLERSIAETIPNNAYMELLGMGYQAMLKGVPDDVKDQNIKQLLAGSPVLKRVIRLSHPLEKVIEQENDVALASNNEELVMSNTLKRRLDDMSAGRSNIHEVKQWIKQQPKEIQGRLSNMMQAHVEVDKVYKRFERFDIPAKSWWVSTASRSSNKAVGDVFYNTWRDAEPQDRRAMERLASAIRGFWTPESWSQFEHLKKEYGIDH